jgi:hypothetical protein
VLCEIRSFDVESSSSREILFSVILLSIAPQRFLAQGAFGPGFLGPEYAPLLVADGQRAAVGAPVNQPVVDLQLKVQGPERFAGVTKRQADERLSLMKDLEARFEG